MTTHNITRSEHIKREESFHWSDILIWKQNQIVNVRTFYPLYIYFIVSYPFLHIYQSSLTFAAALLLLINMKCFFMPFMKAGSPAEFPICPSAHLVFVIHCVIIVVNNALRSGSPVRTTSLSHLLLFGTRDVKPDLMSKTICFVLHCFRCSYMTLFALIFFFKSALIFA